jgi:predicted permease
MSIMRVIIARLRSVWRRSRQDHDLDDELHHYVDSLAEQHERQGLAPDAARRAARLEVGGVEQVKEHVRQGRVGYVLETAARDVRHGCRVLSRSPGYAFVVVLTIALGIGVNVTMFSVMHAVLWRALPYPDAARVVAIEVDARGVSNVGAAHAEVRDLQQQSHLVTNVALVTGVDASLTVDGVMERVAAASVTDDVLPVLGVEPLAFGRTLVDKQDETVSFVSGVVISYELWQRRFQSDPQVVGRHLEVNNIDVQVVGVTREGFRVYLPPAANVPEHVDIWFPRGIEADRVYRGATLIGRLGPAVRVPQAQAELDALAARLVAAHPEAYPDGRLRFWVRPLQEVLTREARPLLLALGVAVSFVLLIACVNVANLMLARAKTRERELAVRRALGATRPRLIRQLLAENVVFMALGGAGGLFLAQGGVMILDWLRPVHLPRQADITIDGVVMLWTAGLAAASNLLFGFFPALFFTGDTLSQPLNSGRSATGLMRSRALQRGLVVAEIALSIIPLIGAGLMLRTFVNLTHAPIGFNPANVLTAKVAFNFRTFSDADRRWRVYREAIDRVRGMPGVEAVSAGGPLPFTPLQVARRYWRDGDPSPIAFRGTQQTILSGYLTVMGIALRAGRDISDDDVTRHRPVVLVDEQVAAQLWGGAALGKRLTIQSGSRTETFEVVGDTAPIRTTRVRDESVPTLFVPYQTYAIEVPIVVKARPPLMALGPAIKRTVESLGTGRPVFDIRPMSNVVAESFDDTRFAMLVLVGFAVAALFLAAVGLYGTLAYLISQRTQEFGIRIALGATAAGIVRLVAREGSVLTGLGGAIGLAGAAGVTRTLSGLLYGVTPLDGVTLASVIALVSAVALVAVSRPAWRAARVDPNVALRGE